MNFQDLISSIAGAFKPKELTSPVPAGVTPEINPERALAKENNINIVGGDPSLDQIKAFAGRGESQPAPTPAPQVGGASSPTDFQSLIAAATQKAQDRGFHPAPVVSQMAAESARGTSNFAKNRNNLFGIGAFDSDLDNTWDFPTQADSIDAYLDLVTNDKRYADAFAQRDNPEAYINSLAPTYASDPNYAQTIMNTPEWRALTQ